jgi:hypothetical protein
VVSFGQVAMVTSLGIGLSHRHTKPSGSAFSANKDSEQRNVGFELARLALRTIV